MREIRLFGVIGLNSGDSEYQRFGNAGAWQSQALRVTGIFLCYRQARYLRQSLAAALAQTWPMQLIVSDDGSADGSDEILRDMVGLGTGQHEVLLRTGQPNLGLVRHLNRLIEQADGDLIVVFAGDDISMPQRVACIAKAALSRPDVMVFGSSFEVIIDGDGVPPESAPERPLEPFDLDQYLDQNRFKWLPGATMAFRRALVDRFGALPTDLWAEDITIFLRALMIGRAWFLSEALIQYRIVAGSLSRGFGLYGDDVESVVAAHKARLRRVAGLASTLSADIAVAEQLPQSNRAALSRLRRRFLKPWRIEEDLHLAVAGAPRLSWLLPALRALKLAEYRSVAVRLLAIALAPRLFFALKAWRRSRSGSQASGSTDSE